MGCGHVNQKVRNCEDEGDYCQTSSSASFASSPSSSCAFPASPLHPPSRRHDAGDASPPVPPSRQAHGARPRVPGPRRFLRDFGAGKQRNIVVVGGGTNLDATTGSSTSSLPPSRGSTPAPGTSTSNGSQRSRRRSPRTGRKSSSPGLTPSRRAPSPRLKPPPSAPRPRPPPSAPRPKPPPGPLARPRSRRSNVVFIRVSDTAARMS